MSEITIEKVEQILERFPQLSYKEAKEALVETDGDVLEAIIYLEENGKNYGKEKIEEFGAKFTKETEKIRGQLLRMVKSSNKLRIAVVRDEKVMLNIPLTIGVVGIAVVPIVALFGLSAAILSKHSVVITDEDSGEEVNLGELNGEKIEILKDMIFNSFENVKKSFEEESEVVESDDENTDDITDELINEDEK